jgi:hypothetical protein
MKSFGGLMVVSIAGLLLACQAGGTPSPTPTPAPPLQAPTATPTAMLTPTSAPPLRPLAVVRVQPTDRLHVRAGPGSGSADPGRAAPGRDRAAAHGTGADRSGRPLGGGPAAGRADRMGERVFLDGGSFPPGLLRRSAGPGADRPPGGRDPRAGRSGACRADQPGPRLAAPRQPPQRRGSDPAGAGGHPVHRRDAGALGVFTRPAPWRSSAPSARPCCWICWM